MLSGYRYRGRLERLIGQWTEVRQLILTRLGSENVGAGEERKFLSLKGKIVEGLAGLGDQLSFDTAQEASAHVRAINNLLNRFPTLYADGPLTSEARAEFEREWHSHFLYLNKLKGLDGSSESVVRDSRTHPSVAKAVKGSGAQRWGIFFLRLAIVVAVLGLIIRFVPWDRLLPEGQRGKVDTGELGAFVSSIWDSVWGSMRGLNMDAFFGPVVDQYGSEMTLVLVAMLLLAVGYFLFLRSK